MPRKVFWQVENGNSCPNAKPTREGSGNVGGCSGTAAPLLPTPYANSLASSFNTLGTPVLAGSATYCTPRRPASG